MMFGKDETDSSCEEIDYPEDENLEADVYCWYPIINEEEEEEEEILIIQSKPVRHSSKCAICWEPKLIYPKQKLVYCHQSCGNTFHKKCVRKCKRCPMCRHSSQKWKKKCFQNI